MTASTFNERVLPQSVSLLLFIVKNKCIIWCNMPGQLEKIERRGFLTNTVAFTNIH